MANQKTTNNAFEQQLFKAADKLRKNIDAAEYKHVVLGLIFLKYISESFEELYSKLGSGEGEYDGANPEDKDEYRAESVFYVPKNARWDYLQSRAKSPTIGEDLDKALDLIEKENPTLKGIPLKIFARPNVHYTSIGGLIDLISNTFLIEEGKNSKDLLGRVYEYFLGEFANAEGKKGGQFYTPKSIVNLMVAMIQPISGRVYDPCCGSGGMFVASDEFIRTYQDKRKDHAKASGIGVFGQESNQTTWRLCRMNLAIRHIDAEHVVWNTEGSFLNDAHKDLKADFILANPPFNDSDWKGEMLREDVRWKFGVPPTGNANFAWVSHFIHHLAPAGIAGFVLANGSMSSNTSNEGEIRKNIVETDLVDCMVALPSQLFYNTMIPACLWFVARDKKNHKFRDRQKEVLFIDARKLGVMIDRRHRELTDNDVKKISDTYHVWRGETIDNKKVKYKDVLGFCKSVKIDEIRKHEYILTPGRYVGAEEEEEDTEVFEEKMKRLTSELSKQMKEGKRLDEEIKKNLKGIGYGF